MGPRGCIGNQEKQYNAEISRRIEELRVARKVRRVRLAQAAGVSPSRLYAFEVGISRWPTFRVRLIADFFRVPVSELLPEMAVGE